MSAEPRINISGLKAAIISATGPGKPFTRRGLSMKASNNKNPDLVRDLISRGQDKKLSLETVAGIATALDRPLSDFIADAYPEINTIEVIGAVEAGVWRESFEWPQEQRYTIEVLPSPIAGAARRALMLVGYSMDKVFPPNSIIEYFPTIENNLKPEPGDLVIAQRRNGDLYETTCKRLIVSLDGDYLLSPESTRAEHQELVFLGKPDNGHYDDSDVTIIGIVVRSYQGHFRNNRS